MQPGQSSQVIAQHSSVTFAGPLPPPTILRQYDEILPGAAERILAMAERQAGHRQSLEASVIGGNIRDQRLGVIFGFIVALLVVAVGALLLSNGKSVIGLAAVLSPLAVLAGIFVYGRKSQERERKQNRPKG